MWMWEISNNITFKWSLHWGCFLPWEAFCGRHDYHFCCAVACGVWKCLAKFRLKQPTFVCRCYRWSFTWLHEWSSSWFRGGGSRGEPSRCAVLRSWTYSAVRPLTFAEGGWKILTTSDELPLIDGIFRCIVFQYAILVVVWDGHEFELTNYLTTCG